MNSRFGRTARIPELWPMRAWRRSCRDAFNLPYDSACFALGDQDKAKYAAIGEADNFVLKFRKLAQ